MEKVKETECRIQGERMVTNYECKAALHGEDEAVNRPAHYRGKTLECIDVIHDIQSMLQYILDDDILDDKERSNKLKFVIDQINERLGG